MKKESRRQFLKGTLGMLGGAMTAQAARLFPELQAALAQAGNPTAPPVPLPEQLEVGELYSGFLLLPEGAPVPDFVQYPPLGIPIMCGTGAGRGGPVAEAVTEYFSGVDHLRQLVPFKVYDFRNLPNDFELSQAMVLRHGTGELFETGIAYNGKRGRRNGKDNPRRSICIIAQPDYPRPFPLWSSIPVEPNGPSVVLQKVDFLPIPGIMMVTGEGYVFHWIEGDVLYTLDTELSESIDQIVLLLSQLTG